MSPNAHRSYRRRRWVTAPAYQWSITSLMLAGLLFVVLVTVMLVYYALWSTLHDLELAHEAVFVSAFATVGWMVAVAFVMVIPIAIGTALFLTHQVVGPINRINTALDQIGQGNYSVRLALRGGDVLTQVADAVNRLAGSLQQRGASNK